MIKKFLDLGYQPIANSFLKSKKEFKNEYKYKLHIGYDTKNFLVSLIKKVNPKKQYTMHYAHRASESKTMQVAFKKAAEKFKKKFKPKKILEIGSNDGVFVKNFNKKNIIAVEPCLNLAKLIKKLKFKVYETFWNKSLARKILHNHGKMNLIYSANTISHIPNLKETFESIKIVLANDGVFIVEDPSLYNVIKNMTYDQFYDEHVYLFSVLSMMEVTKEFNMNLFDIEKTQAHGGSIRYFISNNLKKKKTLKLIKALNEETNLKMHKFATYRKFGTNVSKSRLKLSKLLKKLKTDGKKIISYGATYKSTTIFNYCNINNKIIDYVVDTTKNKQGKYTPGSHLKILSPKKGFNRTVNYAFLGAWNFKKEILKKEKKFLMQGGKFITHTPKVSIISKK
jgi:methylation protein EvaC